MTRGRDTDGYDATAGLFPGTDPTSAAHRATDWSATPLGPVGSWPAELRAAGRTVLPSKIPMLLWWGPELVQIFNDPYNRDGRRQVPGRGRAAGREVLGRGVGHPRPDEAVIDGTPQGTVVRLVKRLSGTA